MSEHDEECNGCGQCAGENEEFSMEKFEKEAYRSFMSFPGVTRNEEDGSITLPQEAQARIILTLQNSRTSHAQTLNVLGALKFLVKTEVDPLPDEVKKALVLADALVEDPEGVEIRGVDTRLYDQIEGDLC
jgi:hypothetical protein